MYIHVYSSCVYLNFIFFFCHFSLLLLSLSSSLSPPLSPSPQGILQDLFPGIELPEHDYGILQSSIENAALSRDLQVVPTQVKKVIQLYETMQVRHGLMLVGPTGGGKTTCYQVNYIILNMYTCTLHLV